MRWLWTFALLLFVSPVVAEEDGFRPLWNGQNLDGWHAIGKGEWTIADGEIIGSNKASEPEYGHLVTDAEYADFEVRLKFKSLQGNSGLYFRIAEEGFSGVTGFQAEIDARNDIGGLYETNGRAWVVQPKAEKVSKYFKPDDWNTMVVTAKGPKVTVTINDVVTADIDDPQGRKQGHLALQVHGGQDVLVHFKEIEIRGEPIGEEAGK